MQFRMLPNLTINKLFGIVILFHGNFQGILYRQNTSRSSKFCSSLHPSLCCSLYMSDHLPHQGLCTCCSLCLESSFPHILLHGHLSVFSQMLPAHGAIPGQFSHLNTIIPLLHFIFIHGTHPFLIYSINRVLFYCLLVSTEMKLLLGRDFYLFCSQHLEQCLAHHR